MEKVFKDIGVISSFDDLRFLIDKIENYINKIGRVNNDCYLDCRYVDEAENNFQYQRKYNIELRRDNDKLKDKLKWFIRGCERVIRENKLSKNDFDNLTNLINSGNNLLDELD
jgi:hypothetical protein